MAFRYCFGLGIRGPHTVADLQTCISRLKTKFIKRDNGLTGSDLEEWLVLGVGGVAATLLNPKNVAEEIRCECIVGINANVTQAVRDALSDFAEGKPFIRELAFDSNLTNQQLLDRLNSEAGQLGCSHAWGILANASAASMATADNAALLAKFTQVV